MKDSCKEGFTYEVREEEKKNQNDCMVVGAETILFVNNENLVTVV